MLILFTLSICIIMYNIGVSSFTLLLFYIMGFAILKGFLTTEFRDVFNIRSISYMFEKVGIVNSFISFISLSIIFVYYIITEYNSTSVYDIIIALLTFLLVYRFLFWDIAYTIKSIYKNA